MRQNLMMKTRLFHVYFTIQSVVVVIILWSLLIDLVTQAREPRDITRAEGETDVFIPCPFEFRPAPSLWRIDGTVYFSTTLPQIYTQTAGGLFINRVDRCLNYTSFQCIDISDNRLQGQESSIGYLIVTVMSEGVCAMNGSNGTLQDFNPESIELDYQRTMYGSVNTTLAWVNTAGDCSINQVLSYPRCQPNNADINVTTSDTEVTVPSESLWISGDLADFKISSSSDQQSAELDTDCPDFLETIRINVTETKRLNLLAGNNNCTCVDIDCQGSLYVAISIPNTSLSNVPLCPINTNMSCYSPDVCSELKGMIPFFRICKQSARPDQCTYNISFGNITEQLNGTRLDFFVLTRTLCNPAPPYLTRTYVHSFEMNVEKASVNLSADITTGQVCFNSSPQGCSLIQLTHYNISITDLTRNAVFLNETIPESSCVTIHNLSRLECHPFYVSIDPFNDFITYSSVNQPVADIMGDVCRCINNNVEVQISNISAPKNALININYMCFTKYLTKLSITLIVSTGNRTLHQHETFCSSGSFPLNSSSLMINQCGELIDLNVYWTFIDTDQATSIDCSLFNDSMRVPCPSMPSTLQPGVIAVIVIISVIAIILTVAVIIMIKYYDRFKQTKFFIRMSHLILHKENKDKGSGTSEDQETKDTTNDTSDHHDQGDGKSSKL